MPGRAVALTLHNARGGGIDGRTTTMLTSRQHDLLMYIDRQLQETGHPPSFEDMKYAVKAKSMAAIYREISALEEHGYISRQRGRPRALKVLAHLEPRRVTGTAIHGDPCSSPWPAAEQAPGSRLPWECENVAGLPMWAPHGAGTDMTTPGPETPVGLSSPRAQRMAMDAVCRGYDLAETSQHPALVLQAIELSHLMIAYGMVPTQPEFAAEHSVKTWNLTNEFAQEECPAGGFRRPADSGQHILVVDDLRDVLVSVTAFLRTAGFMVVTATNGDAALQLIAADPRIDVLITDYVMPGMSGVDLIDQAVRLRPHLKALLVTGYPHADGLAELPPHVTVLAKPFRRAALIAQVRLLEGEAVPVRSRDMKELVVASFDGST
jgi:CheY-like chemotaxis protein